MEDFKLCFDCDEMKEIEEFRYKTKAGNIGYRRSCHSCVVLKRKLEKKHYKLLKGGSTRVKQKPNEYMDESQKSQTFQFMELCGWKFNTENNIWWKEGIKTPEGEFINFKPRTEEDKFFSNKKTKFSKEKMKELYFEHQNGLSMRQLGVKYKISSKTVHDYILRVKQILKNENG